MRSHTRRTTLILNDNRINELKRLAAARNATLSAVVDEMLAEGILRARTLPRKPVALPSFDMGAPGVDVGNRSALYELIGHE